jgi:hypothetical protein
MFMDGAPYLREEMKERSTIRLAARTGPPQSADKQFACRARFDANSVDADCTNAARKGVFVPNYPAGEQRNAVSARARFLAVMPKK